MSSNKKSIDENEEKLDVFWGQVENGDIEIDNVIGIVAAMLDKNPRIRFVDKGSWRVEKGILTARHKRHLRWKKPWPKKTDLGCLRQCVLAHLHTVGRDEVSFQVAQLMALCCGRPGDEGAAGFSGVPPSLGVRSLLESTGKLELGYTDLFDDELYDPAEFSSSVTTTYRDHVNTLRFQVLLSILFGKQIVVPEQWAISSATFMHVAGEVLEGYDGRDVMERTTNSRQSRHVRLKPPFLVHFLNRGTQVPGNAFLKAYINRLAHDSRVRLSGALEGANDSSFFSARAALRDFLIEKINEPLGLRKFDDDFTSYLGEILQCHSMARNFSTVATYLSRTYGASRVFDERKYQESRLGHVNDVMEYCGRQASAESGEGFRFKEFKDFFRRAKKDRIYGDVMKMWPLAKFYSDDTRALIQKMGQYTVHSALSCAMHAGYGSRFYHSFGASKDTVADGLDQRIIAGIRDMKSNSHSHLAQTRDFHMLATRSCASVDLGDSIRWPAVWESVWAYSVSDEWMHLRRTIDECLAHVPVEKVHEHEIWQEVFFSINRGIAVFRVMQQEADKNRFLITLPTPASGKKGRPLNDEECRDSQLVGPIPMLVTLAGYRHRHFLDLSNAAGDGVWRRGRHQAEA